MQRLKNLFYTGLLISLLYGALNYLGLIGLSNIGLYDALSLRFYQPITSRTVVVEFNPSLSKSDFSSYLDSISKAKPSGVVLVLPDDENMQSWSEFAQAQNLSYAKRLGLAFGDSGKASIQERSAWQPSAGYVLPLSALRGINRSLPISASATQRFPSFLNAYLDTVLASSEYVESEYIDFVNVPRSIPFIAMQTIQSQPFADELFQNRFVLITVKEPHFHSGVTTPFYVEGLSISEMQYQAMALEAIMNKAFVSLLPLWAGIVVLMGVAVAGFLLLTSNELKWAKILILALFVVVLPLIYVGFTSLRFIPPLTEAFLSICVAANMFFYVKRKEDNAVLLKINNEVQTRLKHTILPKSFTQGDDPWSKIAVLVQQQLKLHRSIFLEKVPGDHRVREINAINCSIDDIHEMRRDFLREPYKSAINARNLTETNRPYFKHKADNETEFLIPFLVGVDVLGFWALTVIDEENWNRKRFNANVENMANQISQLLLYKQRWARREELTLWRRLRAWFYSENQYLNTLHNVEQLTKKIDFIHRMFATMNTATIIYDLFGQVIEINHAMEALAEKLHLSVFNLSALSLLHHITGLDEDLLRGRLRAIILHQNKEQLVTTVEVGEESFVLSVRPIISSENTLNSDAPFKVLGLLCEFFDAAEVRDIQNIERSLYSQFSARIKNHLSAIQMASLQIERHFGNKDAQMVSHMIQSELQDAAEVTRNTQKLMRSISERKESRLLPFDAFKLVQTRAEGFRNDGHELLNIHTQFPIFVSLGYGNLELITSALDAIFTVLEEDAIAPKTIKVSGKNLIRKGKCWVYIRFVSEGYGLPLNYINQLQSGEIGQGDNTNISQLAKLIKELKSWGMGAKIKSRLGKGLTVIVALEGVNIEH